MARAPHLPLAGYRVVELAHHLAGPLAGMYLGDFGADVVKVEPLEGDDWRRWGRPSPEPGMSQLFLAVNRNKRSLALDVTRPEGRAVLEQLLRRADVLLTNYQPDILRRLRLDRRSLRRFPRLVVASLSAFGTRGPDAGRRAFDIIVAGETGLLLPHPDGVSAPLVPSAPVADTAGALMVAYGVVLALLQRERGGRAQAVETALVNVPIALQAHRFIWLDGETAPELNVPTLAVYGAYATRDSYLTIACLAERLWTRLCRALGLEVLLEDPRFTPWANLVARQRELRPLLEDRFLTRTTEEWLGVLLPAGVPAGRVNWGVDVFRHPQLEANGVVRTVRHPRAGRLTMMGFPLGLALTPARLQRQAPGLGAHSRQVLGELGYGATEVKRLVSTRVVRASR